MDENKNPSASDVVQKIADKIKKAIEGKKDDKAVILKDGAPAKEGEGALANVLNKINEIRIAAGLKSDDPEKDKLFKWGAVAGAGFITYKLIRKVIR